MGIQSCADSYIVVIVIVVIAGFGKDMYVDKSGVKCYAKIYPKEIIIEQLQYLLMGLKIL